ncbi:sporulation protein Cse60 [Ferdinandcohnia quinoae]|uniref:Sporulation protein Cse60 n=1 Tax=Fredinandcohnia quinoae TaxID=2918902 RepID=A0AAW5E6X0_9BACI|nr:sporulation protein Cse60 [Fredinandcohnia sp. SECRCQ15]
MNCKVKLFDEEHEEDLEREVNRFLSKIDESDIMDIKYQVAVSCSQNNDQIFCFSAMILYRT